MRGPVRQRQEHRQVGVAVAVAALDEEIARVRVADRAMKGHGIGRQLGQGASSLGLWAISHGSTLVLRPGRWQAPVPLWQNDRLYSTACGPSPGRGRVSADAGNRCLTPPGTSASQTIQNQEFNQVAVKIRLKRMGKKFAPFYRVVVLDARKKRDGRVIEEIGLYDPMQEPSLIRIDSERAQYWLGVGAQPSDTVFNLLKITGDYQKFKGLPGAEGTLKVKDADAEDLAKKAAVKAAADDAEKRKAAAAEAKAKADKEAAQAAAESEEPAEAPAEEA